ncbi:MAG: rhomboid family intramembrane serine protease, partial [Opitutaceae bacterium]|nr:rhomboid family intramembrane serine protease [Opitutaceae bacterium]
MIIPAFTRSRARVYATPPDNVVAKPRQPAASGFFRFKFAAPSALAYATTPTMHSDHKPQPPSDEHLARAHAEHRRTVEFYQRLHEVSAHHNPRFSVTNIIVALNVIVFIIMGILGAGWLMPTDANILVYAKYGANNGAATTNGEWWRLLTSMFMHYGIMHVAV